MTDQNTLEVAPQRVVRLHYSVLDADSGKPLETTAGGEPLTILHGQGGMLAVVQDALVGKVPGDTLEVTVPPEQAFGPRKDAELKRLSKKYFRDAKRLKPGLRTSVQTEQGPRPVTVVKVGGKMVDVDTNHPYAGRTLTFSLEVVDVRAATQEELAHGHAHGPGGHQH